MEADVVVLRSGRAVYREPARDAWGEWVAAYREWDLFGGMTFDQKRFETYRVRVGKEWKTYKRPPDWRMPRDVAVGRFEGWHAGAERLLGRSIDYICALEYQRNGWPHFHPLLALEGLRMGDIAQLGTLWYERAGLNKLEAPRSLLAVAEYSAKYLAKDLAVGDVLLSPGLGQLALQPVLGLSGAGVRPEGFAGQWRRE